MRDVEQSRRGPTGLVLSCVPVLGVAQRHVEAGKWARLRAVSLMEVVERRPTQRAARRESPPSDCILPTPRRCLLAAPERERPRESARRGRRRAEPARCRRSQRHLARMCAWYRVFRLRAPVLWRLLALRGEWRVRAHQTRAEMVRTLRILLRGRSGDGRIRRVSARAWPLMLPCSLCVLAASSHCL